MTFQGSSWVENYMTMSYWLGPVLNYFSGHEFAGYGEGYKLTEQTSS